MSVVVAVKYDNGVVIGSDTQITHYGHLKNNIQEKVFKSKYSNTAIGITGSLRDMDLISCNIEDLMKPEDILNKIPFNKKYIVNNVVTRIFSLLKHYDRVNLEEKARLESDMIVVDSDNIFVISFDGSVLEFDKYATIGSGAELVYGHLDSINTENLSRPEAIDLVKKCITKACKNEIHISEPAHIIYLSKEKD